MLERFDRSSIHSGTSPCWHSEKPSRSPWTQKQVGDMVGIEKQDCYHPLGSVGPGKADLMGTHELPNHTIWFTFFSPFQNKQTTPVYFFPTGPGFGDFRLLFGNSGLSDPVKPGNLLYSYCFLMAFVQEEFPIRPCVWYLAVSPVVLLI